LKDRLAVMQREVTNKTESMVQRMRQMTGETKSIKLDDLDEMLKEKFNAADSNGSGTLNLWQFSQAWMSLDLEELRRN